MSFMATATTPTPTNFCFSPSHETQRTCLLRTKDEFLCFKSFPKISFFSSNFNSTTSIRASTLLNNTTNRERIDCNTEICRFCEAGNLKNAMEILCHSPKSDIELKTFCSVLQLCAEQKSIQDGKKFHSIVNSSGLDVHGILGAKLVFMYITCGDLREGRKIFDEIENEKVFLWNLLMNEYTRVGNFKEAISLYKRMRELEIEPNSYTFSCVLKCLACMGNLVEGQQTHGYLLKLGYGSYNSVGNALITFYSKCKKVESARKVFDELSDQDVISWNSIIGGYISNGYVKQGLELFSKMKSSGINVDLVTMVTVLPACAEMGILLFGRALIISIGLTHSFSLNSVGDHFNVMFSD